MLRIHLCIFLMWFLSDAVQAQKEFALTRHGGITSITYDDKRVDVHVNRGTISTPTSGYKFKRGKDRYYHLIQDGKSVGKMRNIKGKWNIVIGEHTYIQVIKGKQWQYTLDGKLVATCLYTKGNGRKQVIFSEWDEGIDEALELFAFHEAARQAQPKFATTLLCVSIVTVAVERALSMSLNY